MPNVYLQGLVQVKPTWLSRAVRQHLCVMWARGAAGTGPYTIAQLTAVQTAVDGAEAGVWSVSRDNASSYTGSIITDFSSNTGLQAGNLGFAPHAGTGGAAAATENTAVLVSLRDGIRYRGGHGRVYLPCVAQAGIATDGKTVNAPTVTQAFNYISGIQAALAGVAGANGGPFSLVVWHHRAVHLPLEAVAVLPAANGITAQTIAATQRRRLRKAAHH